MTAPVRPGQHCRVTVDGVEREGYVRCAMARDPALAVVHVDRLHAVLLIPFTDLRPAEE